MIFVVYKNKMFICVCLQSFVYRSNFVRVDVMERSLPQISISSQLVVKFGLKPRSQPSMFRQYCLIMYKILLYFFVDATKYMEKLSAKEIQLHVKNINKLWKFVIILENKQKCF